MMQKAPDLGSRLRISKRFSDVVILQVINIDHVDDFGLP